LLNVSVGHSRYLVNPSLGEMYTLAASNDDAGVSVSSLSSGPEGVAGTTVGVSSSSFSSSSSGFDGTPY